MGVELSMQTGRQNTALTRMGLSRAQQVQSQVGLRIEAAASLSQVSIAILQAQPDDRIIQDGHDVTGMPKG